MAKNLLIVESPAKAKTINKYLGKDFNVLASYGHVRDLIPKEGAVDPSADFAMTYETIAKNAKHVDAIAKAAREADALYLATDLDREGEAISWHVLELLREKRLLKDKTVHRVVFSEITPRAIKDAVAHPRELSMDMVNAQQARRALDYLVGFKLSPVLWRKVQSGLSAGRVQSPALRMIVEREEEIERFISQEYWTLAADCQHADGAFQARLTRLKGRKLEQFDITNEADAQAARSHVMAAASGELVVAEVGSKERRRRPAPPFTTSTLQQEAARKLGFGTQRTMRLAQQLYEGIATDEGVVGLITYMRTDSVHLSGDALSELRSTITREYGENNLPPEPNFYKTKSKNAQEAHEAVRPTSAARLPSSLVRFLSKEQLSLYELIWKRTVACQMKPALLNTVSVDLAAGKDNLFRVSGSTVIEPGFLLVYEEGRDQKSEEDEEQGRRLPAMKPGEKVRLQDVLNEQHFTEPPPRFSEASLVKTLEEYGIGRPSTYASIIQTLLSREYVELESRRFHPTNVGRVVSKFLSGHFAQYVDYDFTARLEDELDAVSRGEKDWKPVLREFWTPFIGLVEDKMETVDKAEATGARVLGNDPASGRPVSVRLGRYGAFAQIGTKDDEDKPKFASLRPGQKLDTISLPEALELFKLPRALGETADGESVTIGVGRFGPFVKYGSKYASLKKEDDPYTIELPRALELIREKEEAAANRIINSFDEGRIQVLNGRFGPYVSDGEKNANVPKDREASELTQADCVQLLAEKGKPVRKGKAGKPARGAKAAKAKTGDAADKPAKTRATKAAGSTATKAAKSTKATKSATGTRSTKAKPANGTAKSATARKAPAAKATTAKAATAKRSATTTRTGTAGRRGSE